jgi:hypothetical protein
MMKLKPLIPVAANRGKLIARFGQAALIRQSNGRWHLQGGSREDRLTAKEYISFFMHEVVLSAAPHQPRAAPRTCSRFR